jgi:hypothetical protein
VRARLKPLAARAEGAVARVCCGRPSCPAELGRLYERHDGWPGDAPGLSTACLLGNAAGYRRHGDAFRVERRPRRAPPGEPGDPRGGRRHAYPWLPELPVTIICPVCGARNRVERPGAPPPSVAERSDIWYTV